MEQNTYFITEVDVDDETYLSRDFDIDDKTYSNVSDERIKSNQKRKRRNGTLKVTNIEKRILAKLVEQEPVVWNKSDKLHRNTTALVPAWNRIASEMPGRSVSECKTIWRSLKDAIRHRQKKVAKHGDSADEIEEYQRDDNWEFSDCLAFMMQGPWKKPRRSNPIRMRNTDSIGMRNTDSSELGNGSRMNDTIGMEHHDASESRITSDISVDVNVNPNDDNSDSESYDCYPTNVQKKDTDPLSKSMISISNSIREFVKGRIDDDQRDRSTMKFDYIWRNLDKLFQKLPEETVDELNVKFMQMAYEKIPKA